MQDARCRMQTPWAGLARSSVLGVRPSALIRSRVTGTWNPVPGTRLSRPLTPSLPSCILYLAYPVCGFFEGRCQVPGTRYRVPAIWHLGPGTRHRSRSDAEGRIPSTEDRARPRLGLGTRPWRDEGQGRYNLLVSLVQAEGREPKAGHRIRYLVPDTRYPVPNCRTAVLPSCPTPFRHPSLVTPF